MVGLAVAGSVTPPHIVSDLVASSPVHSERRERTGTDNRDINSHIDADRTPTTTDKAHNNPIK